MGGTLVIALVDKTRLAGLSVPALAVPSVKLGLTSHLGMAPGYTGAPTFSPLADLTFCSSWHFSITFKERDRPLVPCPGDSPSNASLS